ncbi:MAG TPA: class I SAM-dependent methyltransferase [Nitrospira sp.]|nr:class I SAM-dependent methyltransferase [Nitrospira sp.]
MADRSTTHHITTHAVAQTLLTYEMDAEIFLKQWGRKKYKKPPLLVEWASVLPQPARVLDLGCGAGQDARYLTKLGHQVIGLDRTMPLLRFARRRSASVPFVLADMRTLPVRSGSLDGVWAAASLIHVPKSVARQVLRKLRDCVQPDGLLAATVTYGLRSRVKEGGWMPGRYFARWKKDELARVLARAGWQVLSLRVVSNRERKGRWINVIARGI